jgi:hypothetical protein
MMRGHLERWFELVLISGAMVLVPALGLAALSLAIPALAGTAGVMIFWLVVVAVWPVIQYAWAFFYLRLVEIENPIDEPRPAYAASVAAAEPLLAGAQGAGPNGQAGAVSSPHSVSESDARGV